MAVLFVAHGWLELYFGNTVAAQTSVVGKVGDQKSAKRPVILLTGFEPFGEGRLPNASWEGIHKLNGQTWKEYQLVCKEVPVVWGAPIKHLSGWIAEYQPVAIFSFGQGMPNAFALETRASNFRGNIPDNLGERPPTPTIAKDGPSQYQASSPFAKFARSLAQKGHPVRVSQNAGHYLCEEALYSLEYLKSTKQLPTNVMFCHVPPLGSSIGGKPVTAEYVQHFVQDVLETWHVLHLGDPSGGPVSTSSEAEQRQVQEFVTRYFRTWSDRDMKGYDACFLPEACIQHIDVQGKLSTRSRQEFIANQRDYHEAAPQKTVKEIVSVDIRFEAKLASAVVNSKLSAGLRTAYGYEHITLMKTDENWRIVNLVFYAAPSAEKK